jgi:1-acyl-sn-glycerol-3-phosphate acyltransferase
MGYEHAVKFLKRFRTEAHMTLTNWHYDTAKDSGLSFLDRLKQCPREPDPLVFAARVAAAVWVRAALRIYNRFEISGREHLPREGSFVLVANHSSHIDAVALLSALPLRSIHRAYPVAARDYFLANELRFALTAVIANVMLFDRDSKGVDGLRLCKRMLDERGNVLVMFPEGTRSIDGCVGMFRRGVGLLLAGSPYPVVPCYLGGTFRALPKGAILPRPARVRLAIGEARTYQKVERTDAGALQISADLRSAVLALSSEPTPQPALPVSQEAYQ